jgi:hypothetical protein
MCLCPRILTARQCAPQLVMLLSASPVRENPTCTLPQFLPVLVVQSACQFLPTCRTVRSRCCHSWTASKALFFTTQLACEACSVAGLVIVMYRPQDHWYNAGYIFPDGFHSRCVFRSSVDIGKLVAHDCLIVGERGAYWPKPTFMIVAADRKDEPVSGRSATAAWKQVLTQLEILLSADCSECSDFCPPVLSLSVTAPRL